MMSPGQFAGLAIAAILAGVPLGVGAQTPGANDSPFAPPPGAAGAPGAAPEAFELAGASATGDAMQVCIYNSQTKRSNWIAVGASGDGIKVLSFDPDRDQAVVTMNGERKVLSLRKATVTQAPMPAYTQNFSSLSPVTPPALPVTTSDAASAQPPIPTDARILKDERDAREARMMISDLMEIGVQQRKAYAEAKAKAAAQAAAGGQ
jgi:hypothetical protein